MRAFLAGALTSLLMAACGDDLSLEQQIIATLRNMEEAAEQGEHFEFIGYVADSFKGQQGSMDRREFHRLMIFQINQNRRLRAQFFPIHVQGLGDGQASARFRILVTGGGGMLPENGRLFEVNTEWISSGSDWMLKSADWEAVHLPDV